MTQSTRVETSGGSAIAQTSPEEIAARGDVDIRLRLINLVFGVVVVLTVAGVAAFFIYPDRFKDFWVIVGPIISGAVSGCLGYIAGDKKPAQKARR